MAASGLHSPNAALEPVTRSACSAGQISSVARPPGSKKNPSKYKGDVIRRYSIYHQHHINYVDYINISILYLKVN